MPVLPDSLAELSKMTGVTYGGAANASSAGQRAGTPKTQAPGAMDFFKNVAKTAVNVPKQIVSGVAQGVVSGLQHTAGGISTALTAGRQNNANEQYRRAIEDAGKRYHELYTSGKMSKAQYTKLSQELIKQSGDLSQQITGEVAGMTSAKDFATGLASTAALPFAAGSLSVAGGTGAAAKVTAALGATGKTGSVVARLAKAPLKYAVVDQPVAQAPGQIATDLKHGNVAGAAGNAALLAAPAAIGLAGKGIKAISPILKEAAFGRGSVLTGALGNRVAGFIESNPKLAPVLKQMEQFTLNQPAVKGNPQKGAEFLASHLKSIGVDPKETDINKIVGQFQAYEKNVQKLNGLKATGKAHELAVVSADYTKAIPKVAGALKGLDTAPMAERVAATNKALDEAGITNQTVRDAINNGVHSGASVKDIEAMLVDQKQIIPGVKLGKGFIATYGPKNQAALPTLKEAATAGAPDLGRAANPVLGAITGGLRKAGLGLEDYNTKQIGMARDNLIKSVDNLHLPIDGKITYEALGKLADEKRLVDPRQLKVSEIEQTLGLTTPQAKQVLSATKSMYDNVPTSVRGIGGKLQDANLKMNPLAAKYSRVQSSLRYGYNPAFRAQQKIEAATLGQVATGGHAVTGDVTKTLNLMRSEKFLPTANSYAGEVLHETGVTNITSHLTLSEEKSLARVLEATAAKNGRSVADELNDDATRQLLRAIVQNPKEGILSSNFAKAANLAFFPSAYNAKVTSLAVKALAKQPPAVQFGILKNVNDFHNWMKTDDGVKWQSDNSEAIGLLTYFTPINSIQQIASAIGNKNVRELGLIGGLPFGVISRVLEGQGIVPKSNPPYLDPKTGEVVPDKIPETMKARGQQALGDILDTMFTFPGRQAGFGSKTDLRNVLTGNTLKASPGETKSVTRTDLRPQDLQKQRVLGTKSAPAKGLPTFAKPSAKIDLGKPTFNPIYRGGNPSKPKGKTLAKRPGTF